MMGMRPVDGSAGGPVPPGLQPPSRPPRPAAQGKGVEGLGVGIRTSGQVCRPRARGGRPAAAVVLLLALSLGLTAGCKRRTRPEPAVTRPEITAIGVNSWLWQSALYTLKFMPLATVDSAGGVIVTDWYQNPNQPDERMKVQVFILDAALRADALQVSATRQVRQGGQWIQAPVRAGTVQRLEEIILERARNLRQAAVAPR